MAARRYFQRCDPELTKSICGQSTAISRRHTVEGNLSGPISKRASFFFNVSAPQHDDAAVINATTLEAALNPLTVSEAVVTPKRFLEFGPRLDLAFE